jgi:hypothetical protein
MKNRRLSQKPVDPFDKIVGRMDWICNSLENISLDSETRSHVQSLVFAAKYILVCDGEIPEEEQDDPSDDDADVALPPLLKGSSRPIRSLRKEWAGPLPDTIPVPTTPRKRSGPSYADLEQQYGGVASRYATTDVSKLKDSNGISGPDPNKYETTYNIDPSSNCPECRGTADSHPIDRRLAAMKDTEGTQYIAHIMCDGTRAYLPFTGSE